MIRARAPASVGNVFTGFDIMGFAIPDLYDEVSLKKNDGGVRIISIDGSEQIPIEAEKNTAGKPLLSMIDELDLDFGFDVKITKGIPLGSGLGGSAASAVASVTAANALLDESLTKDKLLKYALVGEALSSGGSAHGDNVAASLFGGLTMCVDEGGFIVRQLPVPDVTVLILHPHIILKTSELRSILSASIELNKFVKQSMKLSLFMNALYTDNLDDLELSLHDLIIEPQRKALIPHFAEIKEQVLNDGAMGLTISGAGPTLFAWFRTEENARNSLNSVRKIDLSYDIDGFVTKIDKKGSYVITA